MAGKGEFWDEHHLYCLWDDRLWLGLANQLLYMEFKIPKYKHGADKLMDMILQHNGNPRRIADYKGVCWRAQEHDYNNTITNALLMCLVGRMLFIDHDPVYLEMLREQHRWLFKQPGIYINCSPKNIFSDWLKEGDNWTYNQAMQLEGLAYLVVFDDEALVGEYMNDLQRLLIGTINYFKVSDKYIMQ